jgi:hypothetical protein
MKPSVKVRTIHCKICSHVVMYKRSRKGKPAGLETLCFECLVEKAKKEYSILKIKRNRLFDWND